MAKAKEVAEQPEKEAPLVVDDKADTPKKKDAPQRATAVAAALNPKAQAPAVERARAVTAMQREIGNARVANVLGGAEAAAPPEKQTAIPKMAPETGAAKAADAETRERIKQP